MPMAKESGASCLHVVHHRDLIVLNGCTYMDKLPSTWWSSTNKFIGLFWLYNLNGLVKTYCSEGNVEEKNNVTSLFGNAISKTMCFSEVLHWGALCWGQDSSWICFWKDAIITLQNYMGALVHYIITLTDLYMCIYTHTYIYINYMSMNIYVLQHSVHWSPDCSAHDWLEVPTFVTLTWISVSSTLATRVHLQLMPLPSKQTATPTSNASVATEWKQISVRGWKRHRSCAPLQSRGLWKFRLWQHF